MEYLFKIFSQILLAIFVLSEYLPLLFLKRKKRKKRDNYPPISIVIPVKNEEKVIEEAISAWLNIDYPADKEIIICDQLSTDNTQKIVNEKYRDNPRVRYLRIESSNKLNTMLKGIKRTQYEYLAISDADRFPDKNAIKNLMPYMTDDVGAVFGMAHIVDNNKPFQKITTLEYLNGMTNLLFAANIDSVPYLLLHSAIVKKNLLINLEPENLIADDLYLAINIRKQNHKALFIPEVDVGEEHVIDFSDLLKRRLRTSQGTIEIAKTNYLETGFNLNYNAFGLFVIPFFQITTTFANLFTLFLFPLLFLGLFLGQISLFFILNTFWMFYLVLLFAQILRFTAFLLIFPKSAKKVPIWAIFFYPVFFVLIRKWLAGYVFLTYLLGAKYKWKKITSDRNK